MLYLDYSRKEGEWIPNEYGGRENLEAIAFLKEFNEQVHLQYPGVLTIAEESTAWAGVSRPTYLGGLGFSLKWNMGWMNDTLRYMRHEPIHRKYHHDELTFSLIYAFTENFVPAAVARRSGARQGLAARPDAGRPVAEVRQPAAAVRLHVDAPRQEAAVHGRRVRPVERMELRRPACSGTCCSGNRTRACRSCVADLNALYRREPALHEVDFDCHGFEWIDCHNYDDSMLAYIRRAKDPQRLPGRVPATSRRCRGTSYRLGVPERCWYEEIFNSDSTYYGGSNLGNGPGRMAEALPWDGRPFSIPITLPPLGIVMLKPRR